MVTWYENQYGSGVESSNTRPPLVVIFEDFEGFSAPMLQDLIANLQACRENLPFLLIFGVPKAVKKGEKYIKIQLFLSKGRIRVSGFKVTIVNR